MKTGIHRNSKKKREFTHKKRNSSGIQWFGIRKDFGILEFGIRNDLGIQRIRNSECSFCWEVERMGIQTMGKFPTGFPNWTTLFTVLFFSVQKFLWFFFRELLTGELKFILITVSIYPGVVGKRNIMQRITDRTSTPQNSCYIK